MHRIAYFGLASLLLMASAVLAAEAPGVPALASLSSVTGCVPALPPKASEDGWAAAAQMSSEGQGMALRELELSSTRSSLPALVAGLGPDRTRASRESDCRDALRAVGKMLQQPSLDVRRESRDDRLPDALFAAIAPGTQGVLAVDRAGRWSFVNAPGKAMSSETHVLDYFADGLATLSPNGAVFANSIGQQVLGLYATESGHLMAWISGVSSVVGWWPAEQVLLLESAHGQLLVVDCAAGTMSAISPTVHPRRSYVQGSADPGLVLLVHPHGMEHLHLSREGTGGPMGLRRGLKLTLEKPTPASRMVLLDQDRFAVQVQSSVLSWIDLRSGIRRDLAFENDGSGDFATLDDRSLLFRATALDGKSQRYWRFSPGDGLLSEMDVGSPAAVVVGGDGQGRIVLRELDSVRIAVPRPLGNEASVDALSPAFGLAPPLDSTHQSGMGISLHSPGWFQEPPSSGRDPWRQVQLLEGYVRDAMEPQKTAAAPSLPEARSRRRWTWMRQGLEAVHRRGPEAGNMPMTVLRSGRPVAWCEALMQDVLRSTNLQILKVADILRFAKKAGVAGAALTDFFEQQANDWFRAWRSNDAEVFVEGKVPMLWRQSWPLLVGTRWSCMDFPDDGPPTCNALSGPRVFIKDAQVGMACVADLSPHWAVLPAYPHMNDLREWEPLNLGISPAVGADVGKKR